MGQWPGPTINLKAWNLAVFTKAWRKGSDEPMQMQSLTTAFAAGWWTGESGSLSTLKYFFYKPTHFVEKNFFLHWSIPVSVLPCWPVTHQVLINKKIQRKIVNTFLPIIFSVCFGCSKEPSHWDSSFKYPQHRFWLRNKKNIFLLHTCNLSPGHIQVTCLSLMANHDIG